MSTPDRIERLELFHVEVPLPTPFFPIWVRGYAQTHLRFTLLRLTTRDGRVGLATGPAFGREREGLGEIVGPFLVGSDPADLDGVEQRLEEAAVLGWRNAWIATAFWDVAAQARGVPLWRLVAERTGLALRAEGAPERLPAFASFGELRAPSARAEATERALRAGFRAVKLGLDGDTLEDDLAQLEATAAAGPPALFVHAHQGHRLTLVTRHVPWTLARARAFADAAGRRAAWLGEPLPPALGAGAYAELRRTTSLPLALGDFATRADELDALPADVLTPNASVAGLGLVTRAIRRAHRDGLELTPHAFGDGLGALVHLHVVAALGAVEGRGRTSGVELPWEPPSIVPSARDALLAEELEVDARGHVPCPSALGLGATLSERALRRYGHRFASITPVRFAVTSARRTGLKATRAVAQPGRDASGARARAKRR
jgi:L-alanine-DL-glutamate epimerase-like enolase superfamily enzyme